MTIQGAIASPQRSSIERACRLADSYCDISDNWMEATDPENERGEEVTAFFDHDGVPADDEERNRLTFVPECRMIGIRIKGDHGTIIHRSREWAVKMMGQEAVWAVEEHHTNQERGW